MASGVGVLRIQRFAKAVFRLYFRREPYLTVGVDDPGRFREALDQLGVNTDVTTCSGSNARDLLVEPIALDIIEIE
ncbi:hypothetical protein ACJMQP_02125 [Rhodopseudomonas palustris]